MNWMQTLSAVLSASWLLAIFPPVLIAATVPYQEAFTASASNWKNSASADLNHVAAGGADGGGYVSTAFAFAGSSSTTPVLFRGHDAFDASGDALVGNWIADGVTTMRANVRHSLPQPASFFARFAGPANFPGATAIDFAPVPPGTWTQIEFSIAAASSQFVSFEGTDFATVFSGVGNVQIGVSRPAALAGDATPYIYDLDLVTIVPEPAALIAAPALAICGLLVRRRPRRAERMMR